MSAHGSIFSRVGASGDSGAVHYLRAYDTVSEAKANLGRYIAFCNARRPHSSLDGRTPDHVYFISLPPLAAAA